MGKMSSVFIFLLCINILGHILLSSMVDEQLAAGNPYVADNSLLVSLYAPVEDEGGDTVYLASSDSAFGSAVPQNPPDEFSSGSASFIDSILVVFSFVGSLFTVLSFPVALVSFIGLPWQLSTLLFAPLTGLYVFGFIDLFGRGRT